MLAAPTRREAGPPIPALGEPRASLCALALAQMQLRPPGFGGRG